MAETTALPATDSQRMETADATALINRPCYRLYEHRTEVDGKLLRPGVYYHFSDRKTGEPRTRHVCGRLKVVLQAVEKETGLYSILLKFDTPAGKAEWFMDRSLLSGKGGPLCEALNHRGLNINKDGGEEHVVKYIASEAEKASLIRTVRKPGWHGESFVMPHHTYGPSTVRMRHNMESEEFFQQKGTLEAWQDTAGRYCLGNPVLILSVGSALGSMLLRKVGVNGGGFHLKGDSSTGKTLAQRVACSILGGPGLDGYLASWDNTKNGLEAHAESRNDLPLVLDEIKMVSHKFVQEIVYMLANGQGKGRMNQDRESDVRKTWRVLMLSSGEKSLAEHAALSGDPAHAGAELRMIDINAGTRKFLAFDDLHDMDGETFHRTLTVAITDNHGTAGPAFLNRLIQDKDRNLVEEFATLRKQFKIQNAQGGRVADRFAVAALGGELGIEYGVLPWPPGTAIEACQTLYDEWLKTQGSGNTEDRQILGAISDFLDTHGDTRFSDISFGADRTAGPRAGYYELINDNRLYHFSTAGLREAAGHFGIDRVIRALDHVGALKRDRPDRNQKLHRIRNGGRKWLYAIDPEKLTEEHDKED